MKNPAYERERARAMIRSVCSMLLSARVRPPAWKPSLDGFDADLTVLLEDAVRMYCRALSPEHSLRAEHRQPAHWVEQLRASPERCDQILDQIAGAPCSVPEAVHGLAC